VSELKPCPFCGYELPDYEGLIKAVNDEDGILQHPTGVCCSNCGCYQVGGETIEDAIKTWNTRNPADLQALKERVKGMKKPETCGAGDIDCGGKYNQAINDVLEAIKAWEEK